MATRDCAVGMADRRMIACPAAAAWTSLGVLVSSLAIVIPVYNESYVVLRQTIMRIQSALADYSSCSIVVVDDGAEASS